MTPTEPGGLDALYAMPGHLVRRVQQIHSSIFAAECGAFDLTSVQYAALTAIGDNPGVDATRLSALIAFDRSTLGDVLERLELKGWVARSPGQQDRRVKVLHLTPGGADILRQARPAMLRVQTRLLDPLSAEERRLLVHLLTRIASEHNDTASTPLRSLAKAG